MRERIAERPFGLYGCLCVSEDRRHGLRFRSIERRQAIPLATRQPGLVGDPPGHLCDTDD